MMRIEDHRSWMRFGKVAHKNSNIRVEQLVSRRKGEMKIVLLVHDVRFDTLNTVKYLFCPVYQTSIC